MVREAEILKLLGSSERLCRVVIVTFQHRILKQIALDFLLHLYRGKLQQLDRLLQLGRQRQVLRKF